MRLVGAAYLIYMGVRALLGRDGGGNIETAPRDARPGRIFRQGMLVNVTNPKTALFFFAFLPQFINPHGDAVPEQIVVLGLMFAVLGLITDSAWGIAAGSAAGLGEGAQGDAERAAGRDRVRVHRTGRGYGVCGGRKMSRDSRRSRRTRLFSEPRPTAAVLVKHQQPLTKLGDRAQ